MMRATAWTGGLFALGSAICHLFPAPWVEPMVLLGLGVTLLVVSGRGAAGRRRAPAPGAVAASELETAGSRAAQ
ncbi:hypothetical protein [Anaeromyxobacter paludicola]|uniref:Uncharacterized protein n=1 Tax=Anaeromyxobacter paludicola TaxID=2918171 RepID=A0ABM7X8N4_9BACT|nr:hypothetical protein [Anaeromyxobacter paludicola]BDG08199.1 hypothetical protein AMPC_13120 [Anaeromyxobacter paludicola]